METAEVGSPPPREAPPVGDLAALRERAYGVLSGAFLYPDDDLIAALRAAVPELRCLSRPFEHLTSAAPFGALLDALEAVDPSALSGEHATLFLVGTAGELCPPNESAYARGGGFDAGWITSRLEFAYSMVGLAHAAGAEPPDHIAVELEFVSVLCEQETAAWRDEQPEAALIWLRRQMAFLDAHLVKWLPMFASRLASVAPGGFYARAARLAQTFVAHDRELVAALIARVSGGEP